MVFLAVMHVADQRRNGFFLLVDLDDIRRIEASGFLDHAVNERFVREEHRDMLIVEEDPAVMLRRLRFFDPAALTPKWIDREEA